MLRNLPLFIQKQLVNYLLSNNLSAAKSLYEAWSHNCESNAYLSAQDSEESGSGSPFLSSRQETMLERMLTD